MKRIILVLMLVVGGIKANSCLSPYERSQLGLSTSSEDFEYIPNYIECDKNLSNLEKYVCKNKDYLLMFHYLSEVNIHFWERNYKQELNHKTWNKKSMSHWKKKYNSKNINSNYLCFDLKSETADLQGGESPYKKVEIFSQVFFLQENQYGAILKSRNGYKIYLGKSCDVLDSKRDKGYWYYEDDEYKIKLGINKKDSFDEEIDLEKYNCTLEKVSVFKRE